MHHIYVTEGIVLGKRGVGEANTLLYVLTRELGLVRANARSTRVEISKLRYGLEPLTHARFSFVKGRHEWRLVQVESATHLFAAASARNRSAAGRVALLLMRLVRGQETAPLLYEDISEGFAAIAQTEHVDAVETVLVLRILAHLGYLPHTEALAPFVEGDFSIDLAARALQSRSLLIRTINESLQATGL
jgi:DNA repair protein RecO